eukprot:RCo009282
MKKSSSVEAFLVDDSDDKKHDVQESVEWYPFCLRVKCQESLTSVQAAIADAVSVVLNNGNQQCLFIYGHRPFETIIKNLPVHLFTELHIDRQSAYFFEVAGLDTPEAARKAEHRLLDPGVKNVNAAVADHESRLLCVFSPEKLGHAADPEGSLQISLTVDWPFFAALNGRTKFRKVLDASAQFIGIYPRLGGRMLLNRIEAILKETILKEIHDGRSPVALKVVRNPPSVQVSFTENVPIVQVRNVIVSALQAEHFQCEIVPSRVVLWQSTDARAPVFSTALSCGECSEPNPPTPESATEALVNMKRTVADSLRELGLEASLEQVHYVSYSLGGSRCHLWQLAHVIKRGLEPWQEHILAAYVDFTAARLTVATRTPATLAPVI